MPPVTTTVLGSMVVNVRAMRKLVMKDRRARKANPWCVLLFPDVWVISRTSSCSARV